ncbi:hypothetical protein [Mycobacterium kyogaense]|uniref:hypothetical protein n=1 Tax=Mycobacterium kyogaense TaxID=2212479 RepID=UPI000DAC8708|nr:hypothetical protein [Mycobacterium kyogaense]
MFYKRPPRITDHRFFGVLREFVAGVHAGHGVAHGVTPPATSAALAYDESPGTVVAPRDSTDDA